MVSSGKKVPIEYSLKLKGKSVVNTNAGCWIINLCSRITRASAGPGKCIRSMKIGESKQITVTPDEGYEPLDKNAVIEHDKE